MIILDSVHRFVRFVHAPLSIICLVNACTDDNRFGSTNVRQRERERASRWEGGSICDSRLTFNDHRNSFGRRRSFMSLWLGFSLVTVAAFSQSRRIVCRQRTISFKPDFVYCEGERWSKLVYASGQNRDAKTSTTFLFKSKINKIFIYFFIHRKTSENR